MLPKVADYTARCRRCRRFVPAIELDGLSMCQSCGLVLGAEAYARSLQEGSK